MRERATPPEAELALLLAGTAARRSERADRIRELAATVDYRELENFLRRQRLFALVGTRVQEVSDPPPDFVERCEETLLQTRHHAALFGHMSHALAQTLEAEGIEAVPLKGPLLAERIHGDPGLRTPSTDLDFLVPAGKLDRAVELLGGLGYQLDDPVRWADGLPHYHYGLYPSNPAMPRVELHWRVHWYETLFAPALITRSEREAGGIRAASAADELATLVTIFARDGFVGLRLAADLAAWWDVRGHELEPHALDPVLEAHPELRSVLLAGLAVADQVVGLPARELCSEHWRLPARARLATRLANWTARGSWEQVATNITLVDLLLTPRGAGRVFVRHYYLQPVDKYARELGWRPEARLRNHLRRVVRAAVRAFRSGGQYIGRLWALRGGASWSPVPGD
jgi:hypothetical protein